ncbi:MAG: hypothetical protein JHD16_14570 [Solirubrobacteraceae bacterium]|nr:hypothetical protein [Solirubrobacteraceae bacterium]
MNPASHAQERQPSARYWTWGRAGGLVAVLLLGAAWFVGSAFLLVAMLVGSFRNDYREAIGDITIYVPLVGLIVAIAAVVAPSLRRAAFVAGRGSSSAVWRVSGSS